MIMESGGYLEEGQAARKTRRHVNDEEQPNWLNTELIYDAMEVRYKKWTEQDLQQASGLPATEVKRCIKLLLDGQDIVQLNNDDDGEARYYMIAEYHEDEVDSSNQAQRESCLKILDSLKVATLETITFWLQLCMCVADGDRIKMVSLNGDRVRELVIGFLVHRNQVVEVTSDGKIGEFGSVPAGRVCYKLAPSCNN